MFSKKMLVVLALILARPLFAGTMGSGCVTLPCLTQQWELGAQALYLKVWNSGQDVYFPGTAAGDHEKINNRWSVGFELDASYHFNRRQDVKMDWSHYAASTTTLGFTAVFEEPSALTTLYNQSRFDQVDWAFGQYVDFSRQISTRLYAGLQYAAMRGNRFSTYTTADGVDTNQVNNADFNGVGPVVGIDFAYALGHGLTLTANGNASVLYGTNRDNYSITTGVVVPGPVQSIPHYFSSKIVVPSIGAKLGPRFNYPTVHGLLTVEGGYQALNYFSPLSRIQANTYSIVTTNFGLYGAYFGVRWLGGA